MRLACLGISLAPPALPDPRVSLVPQDLREHLQVGRLLGGPLFFMKQPKKKKSKKRPAPENKKLGAAPENKRAF